jgi:hypothetical protein
MRGRYLALALTLVAVAAAGCMLITGSTDGYSAPKASAGTCASAADCGDGGNVCCLSVSNSTTSVVGACQSACTVALPQLCKANAECGDAGPCSMLSCTVDGSPLTIPLQACGTVQGCTAAH